MNFVWLFSWRGFYLTIADSELEFYRIQWFKKLGLTLVWDSAPTIAAAESYAAARRLRPTRRMTGRLVWDLINQTVPKPPVLQNQ